METVSVFVDGPQIDAISRGLQDRVVSPRELLRALLKGRALQKATWYQSLAAGDRERANWLYANVRYDRLFELVTTQKKTVDSGTEDSKVDFLLVVDWLEEVLLGKPDTIILVSGDGDFLKAVRIAKRQGIKVELVASTKGHYVSSSLLLEAGDNFTDLSELLDKISVPLA
jgi:uncharacterized LabA/DUF88 family protein